MGKLGTALLVIGVLLVGGAVFVAGPSRLLGLARPAFADAGGTRVTLEVGPALGAEAAATAVAVAVPVIERRLDSMGWGGASVRREGDRRLVVEVPNVFDTDQVVRLVGTRGDVSFRMVADDPPDDAPRLPQIDESMPALVVRGALLTNDDIIDASVGYDNQTHEPIVNFRFNAAGTKKFAAVTQANVGKPFAIVLDGKILSAPRILGPITGGTGQISGRLTIVQARELATWMRAGSLPASVAVASVQQVKGKG